jgi:hypothetical protein
MPLDGEQPTLPPLEQGFFSFDAYDVRLPDKCPIGIVAKKTKDARSRARVEVTEPPPLQTVDVLSRMGNRRRVIVDGGPVEHPIVRLGDVFRLAWLAADAADPRFGSLPATSLAPSWPGSRTSPFR